MSAHRSSPVDRLIWLRRPARLIVSDIAVQSLSDESTIAASWQCLIAQNPRLSDGPCWHVLAVQRDGHGGATIHVTKTTYRMAAVRSIGVATGFTGLGTKAIAHWQEKCLIGRRADSCATYPGHWEFAPGGSVEPGEDPCDGIERELMEECAVRPALRPRAVALLFDPEAGNWEIIHDIPIELPPDTPPNWEYSALALLDGFELPAPVSPCAKAMVEVARRVINAGRARPS